MSKTLAIGVDLGATKIATALVTRGGEVLAARHMPTLVSEGPEAVCGRIALEIRTLLDVAPAQVGGIGIGSAGLVDARTGVVVDALNLAWRSVPLAETISRHLGGLPVFVENDANANVIGEGFFGSAVGCRHYVLLTIGSGLGCGIVSDGRILSGARSTVSNLGHYSIDPDHGLPCPCGHRGCAETIACGPGLVALTRSLLKESSRGSALGQVTDLTPDRIVTAARAGDGVALQAIETLARVVGEIAAVAAAVADPEMLILGGGLGAAAADLIAPGVAREMARRLPPPQPTPPIRPASLATPAIGSACLVWSREST